MKPLNSLEIALIVFLLLLVVARLMGKHIGIKKASNIQLLLLIGFPAVFAVIILQRAWYFYESQGYQWTSDGNVAAPVLLASGATLLILFLISLSRKK